jgi:hypothetical protein
MNHILNEKLKNKNYPYINTIGNETYITLDDSQKKHFPTSVNEWHNSIYSFKKRTLISLLTKDLAVYTLLDSYFNFEPNVYLKRKVKQKWLSLKRIFISKPEIKHSSNKVVITVYTLNKEKNFYLNKLRNLNKLFFFKIKNTGKFSFYSKVLSKKLKINLKDWDFVDRYVEKGITYPFILRIKKPQLLNFFFSIVKSTKSLKNTFFKESKNLFVLNIIRKVLKYKLKKIYLYKKYTCILYFNTFKFNLNFLLGIKNILYKLYNKKIELNIVSVKYLYLENNILASAVVRKLNNRKKRIIKVLRKALKSMKLPELDPLLKIRVSKKLVIKRKYGKNILLSKYNNLFSRSKYKILRIVLKGLRNKHVIGVTLQGKGRLTRRLTASRSILKSYHIGGLKNIFSSFQGLSAVMLKGFENSNIQYTNINSKSRNGSFGLKSSIGSF